MAVDGHNDSEMLFYTFADADADLVLPHDKRFHCTATTGGSQGACVLTKEFILGKASSGGSSS
jgi:hypothetical protein